VLRLLLFLLLVLPCFADSPLTSTEFWSAYSDVPQVVKASELKKLDASLDEFLLSKVSIDRKAALINALGWDLKGQKNAPHFRAALAQKYSGDLDSQLTADEAFCLGYLTAMDSYNKAAPALPYLERAHKGRPHSFTIAIVHALVSCQVDSNYDGWWEVMSKVLDDEQLYPDLRGRARDVIIDYMKPQ